MTQRQQHTPGPWNKVSGSAVQIGTSYFVRHSNPEMKMAEADVNLIAASPDLLEVLERLMGMPYSTAAERNQAERDARAAIAKAKGDI